jgi:hypothetical protein
MSYRAHPGPEDLDLPERERVALEAINARQLRWRGLAVALGVLLGLTVGIVWALAVPSPLSQAYTSTRGYFTTLATLSTAATFGLALAGNVIGRRLTRRRWAAWTASVGRRHDVPADRLLDILRTVDAL